MNESIYDLIPPEPTVYQRPPMHRSKFRSGSAGSPVAPPTYSTFPAKADRSARDGTASMLFAGRSGVIGRDVGASVDPRNFLKKHAGAPALPPISPFNRSEETPKRSPVPSRKDRPIMGLMTEKDFVHANAVDVICAAPKRTQSGEPRPVERPDFGKVPQYLSTVKAQVQTEKEMTQQYYQQRAEAQQQQQQQSQFSRQLPEEERKALLEKLQAVWEEKHRHFQSLPFSRAKDLNFIVKKEAMEKELKEMEAAMEKLKKKVVVVYTDEYPSYASYARSVAVQQAQTTALKQQSI